METRTADTRGKAIGKGIAVALAAQAAFTILFIGWAGWKMDAGGNEMLLSLNAAALPPNLVAGAALGVLARRPWPVRPVFLAFCATAACFLVVVATFAFNGAGLLDGALIGAFIALLFGAILGPIAIAAGLALSGWVEPEGEQIFA